MDCKRGQKNMDYFTNEVPVFNEEEDSYEEDSYEEEDYMEEENLSGENYTPVVLVSKQVRRPTIFLPIKIPITKEKEHTQDGENTQIEEENILTGKKGWNSIKNKNQNLNNRDYPVLGYIPNVKNDGFQLIEKEKSRTNTHSTPNTQPRTNTHSTPNVVPVRPVLERQTAIMGSVYTDSGQKIIRVPNSLLESTKRNLVNKGMLNYTVIGF